MTDGTLSNTHTQNRSRTVPLTDLHGLIEKSPISGEAAIWKLLVREPFDGVLNLFVVDENKGTGLGKRPQDEGCQPVYKKKKRVYKKYG